MRKIKKARTKPNRKMKKNNKRRAQAIINQIRTNRTKIGNNRGKMVPKNSYRNRRNDSLNKRKMMTTNLTS